LSAGTVWFTWQSLLSDRLQAALVRQASVPVDSPLIGACGISAGDFMLTLTNGGHAQLEEAPPAAGT